MPTMRFDVYATLVLLLICLPFAGCGTQPHLPATFKFPEATQSDYIRSFWTWFAQNEERFRSLTKVSEFDEAALSQRLHKIDKGLNAVFMGDDGRATTLVITADHKASLFPLAKQTVQLAPGLRDWDFVALRPPTSYDQTITTDGFTFNAEDVRVVPYYADQLKMYQLQVLIPDIPRPTETMRKRIRELLQQAIGEELAAGLVYRIDLMPYNEVDALGSIPLSGLYDTLIDEQAARAKAAG